VEESGWVQLDWTFFFTGGGCPSSFAGRFLKVAGALLPSFFPQASLAALAGGDWFGWQSQKG
jgi:hypothetical protein